MYLPHIFRIYDIRGIAGEEFDEDFVVDLAAAYAVYLSTHSQMTCCVGRDGRHTSPRYHQLFADSLAEHGVLVFDLGQVTTPMGYFACFQQESPNCVVITASHNPKEYNGFKMVVNRKALQATLIQEIRDVMESGQARRLKSSIPGDIRKVNIRSAYYDYLRKHFSFKRRHRFLVDCGNGMAGAFARDIFDLFGFEVDILFEEVDPAFPNHPADPTVEKNLKDMIKRLRTQNHAYEFGVGYDGDADRIGVVTPGGQLMYGDQLLLFLSQEMVQKYHHPVIIADVKSSKVFYEGARQIGARPLMFKTGHSLIKNKLAETPDCPLAGEMSGHVFYKDDFFGYDDALYVTLRLVRILESFEINLSEWFSRLPVVFNTPELHVPCSDSHKHRVMQSLEELLSSRHPEAELITIDGLRLEWKDRWALVRPSNTTPVLVLRFEAANSSVLQQMEEEMTLIVKQAVQAASAP
jgi:phosphomannomutase/phosphoglucomutase